MFAQPGEIGIEIVLVEAAPDAEHIAGRMHLRQAHRRQARALLQHPRHDLPQRQLAGESRAERLVDAEAAGGFHDDPHGADGRPLGQLDFVERAERGQVALELEGEFDGGDLLGIAMGEVGDVAFANVSGRRGRTRGGRWTV